MPKRQQAENFREQGQTLTNKLLECVCPVNKSASFIFSTAHDRSKGHSIVVRLIKYPALSPRRHTDFSGLGEQTDWRALTLIFAKTAGLETRQSGDQGRVLAPVVPVALIVNIADGLVCGVGRV